MSDFYMEEAEKSELIREGIKRGKLESINKELDFLKMILNEMLRDKLIKERVENLKKQKEELK